MDDVSRMASQEQYASFSLLTGRNKEFPRWAKVLLTSLARCTRPRNSLVKMVLLPYTAGKTTWLVVTETKITTYLLLLFTCIIGTSTAEEEEEMVMMMMMMP